MRPAGFKHSENTRLKIAESNRKVTRNRSRRKDLTGQVCGRLTVGKFLRFVKQSANPNSGNTALYECLCKCGNTVEMKSIRLSSGNTKSCGCLRAYKSSELAKTTTERSLFRSAKHRAKKQGIPFDLTLDDIVIPDTCPLLGTPLVAKVGNGERYDNLPSLDKKIPSKGYVKGNVWVVSWRANRIKNDATVNELERMVVALKEAA